jgi:4-amino-4-deoxy-L-arabinose transferase-like glycosyltransferase
MAPAMANSTQLRDITSSIQSPEVRQEKRVRFWLPLLCIVALAGAMYATFAVSWVKFSRAEVFFSECAREMIAQNNLVTPLYHNQPFFDKPIWAYWLIISMFKTFGVSHWAARVPSIIASICTIALTAFTTRWVATTCSAGAGAGRIDQLDSSEEQKRTSAGLLAAMFLFCATRSHWRLPIWEL